LTRGRVVSLLLVAHVALNFAVVLGLGFYSPASLLCAVLACAALLFVAGGPAASGSDATPSARVMACWLMALALGGFMNRPLLFGDGGGLARLVLGWNQILFVGGAALLVASFRSVLAGVGWGRIVFGILAAATALRLLVPLASPEPPIDVFSMREQGAAALLAGRNPYETQIRDPIPGGAEQYGYSVGNYAYMPATLLPDALARVLAGDVRVASVLAELLACLCLVQVARRRLPGLWRSPAALLTAAPLLYSKGPYVTEMSWTEPLLLGALAAWWALAALGRERGAAVTFGLFLAFKQYLVFYAVAFFGEALGRGRPLRVAVPAAVVLATVLPFLVWDLESFLAYPVRWMLTENLPFREDALSLAGLWFRTTGAAPPGFLAMAAGAVTAAFLLGRWWRRGPVLDGREDVVLVGTAATLVAFLVGPQAFANYYYFLTNALVLVIVGAGIAVARPVPADS